MEYMLGKGYAAGLVRVSSYIVTPCKSHQNELCTVLNLPIGLQLSWHSGFCPRHDVFTSFCELKCKGSGVSGTNDKIILMFRTQIGLCQTLRHNNDKSLGLILIRLGMQRLCSSIRIVVFVYQILERIVSLLLLWMTLITICINIISQIKYFHLSASDRYKRLDPEEIISKVENFL